MKIAIFENERAMVEAVFDAMNLFHYSNQLIFNFFTSSQDGSPFESLTNYDLIFIDIQLSPKSELDGFNLAKALIPIVGIDKIAVITGHSNSKEILKEMGLGKIPVLIKPIDFNMLYQFIRANFHSLS